MVAFKMNAFAGMLALMGAFAPAAIATGTGTLCSSLPPDAFYTR